MLTPKFVMHTLHGCLINARLAMVAMPTLKKNHALRYTIQKLKDILCSEEKLLMEYEVVGYQKG